MIRKQGQLRIPKCSIQVMLHWQLLLYDLKFLHLKSILHWAFQWTSWHQHNPGRRSQNLTYCLTEIVWLYIQFTHHCIAAHMHSSHWWLYHIFTLSWNLKAPFRTFLTQNITDKHIHANFQETYKYIYICLVPFIFLFCIVSAQHRSQSVLLEVFKLRVCSNFIIFYYIYIILFYFLSILIWLSSVSRLINLGRSYQQTD